LEKLGLVDNERADTPDAKDEWRCQMENEMVALLSSIEAVVNGGKAVVSADNSIIIAMMQEALKHGRSATF
jgi:hypothetical protein